MVQVEDDDEWTQIEAANYDVRTRGGPLELELSVPLVGGGDSACRPTVDGEWAGSFEEGLDDEFMWHEGRERTGRAEPAGTRQDKVVLAQHRDINDPEFGGRYTVEVYKSEKVAAAEGGWRHSVVRLEPASTDSTFEPIVLEDLQEGELRIVAELVEVLG